MNAQDTQHLRLLSIFHYVVAGLAGLFALLPVFHLLIGLMRPSVQKGFEGTPEPADGGWRTGAVSGVSGPLNSSTGKGVAATSSVGAPHGGLKTEEVRANTVGRFGPLKSVPSTTEGDSTGGVFMRPIRCWVLALVLVVAVQGRAFGAESLCALRGYQAPRACECLTEHREEPGRGWPSGAGARSPYFEVMERLSPSQLCCIRALLDRIHKSCKQEDAPCPDGDCLLELFYGVRRPELPNLVVDLRATADGLNPPVLLWGGKNTAHILGADFLWVLVLSDKEVDSLGAQIETTYERSVNPFSGLLVRLGVPYGVHGEEPKTNDLCFEWDRLDLGAEKGEAFFYAWGRLPVGQDSVNFVTISKTGKCKKSPKGGSSRAPIDLHLGGLTVSVAKGSENEGVPRPETGAQVSVRAVSAHFSTSRGTRTAFSVGFGATSDAEETSLGQEGEETIFNGYALAKLYVVKPRLKAYVERPYAPFSMRSRTSFGFVVGTNVDDPFEELVLGLSWGHWLGKLGAFVGMNRISGSRNNEMSEVIDTAWRPIVGLDFTF